DLVTLLEQLGRGPGFEVDIVLIDFRLHTDFAKLHVDLVLLRFAVFLGLFVLIAAEVHEPRHGRAGSGSNLDEVYLPLASHGDRFGCADHAYLLTVFVDQAYLGYPDPLVDTWLRRRGFRRCFWSFPQTAPRLKLDETAS